MPRPKKVIPTTDNIATAEIAETISKGFSESLLYTPPPISPAVLALQSSIVDMIAQRAEVRNIVTAAQSELYIAQAKVQAATGQLQSLESEVQYRMGVIAQLENRAPQAQSFGPSAPIFPQQFMGNPMMSISSEPAMPPRPSFGQDDGVNRAHADRSML